ncbi:XRE family transcriptional regulator [Sporolactobacillus shoreae]|uniref:XRE family transcriptional regulator n=1 Tax=Sporolactobacillus shoreae TaxID=1465501 RepID=A0A4Z0GN96_9BACL|nr:helix-turn-helix transcriptional regulator [Sporolactobacillus shoreae]TGA97269.1 XRE family transcriptional regulator [Sporolactobacillus shoreae]
MLTVDLNKLKEIRKKQMSLEKMSSMLGYRSPNGYYYMENGRSKITAETLAKAASILNVPIQEFFVDDEGKEQN